MTDWRGAFLYYPIRSHAMFPVMPAHLVGRALTMLDTPQKRRSTH